VIATAQRFSSIITIPRANDIACPGVRPKVATSKVTIYLTDGPKPRNTNTAIAALKF
jgi:hypothetical protein